MNCMTTILVPFLLAVVEVVLSYVRSRLFFGSCYWRQITFRCVHGSCEVSRLIIALNWFVRKLLSSAKRLPPHQAVQRLCSIGMSVIRPLSHCRPIALKRPTVVVCPSPNPRFGNEIADLPSPPAQSRIVERPGYVRYVAKNKKRGKTKATGACITNYLIRFASFSSSSSSSKEVK